MMQRDTGTMDIPDEALDAAVEALIASKLGDHAGISGEEFIEAARAALEAAIPHLPTRNDKDRNAA